MSAPSYDKAEPLPLSLLNDFLYCPRRAALKIVEGWRSANQHTVRGDIAHEHADLPGYESQISSLNSQILILRALPVWSERLGLSGKCDVIERHPDGQLVPVEFKVGKRRPWDNDDAQLCAQALCLEEMFDVAIPRGAIFHAASKRRREIVFSDEMREATIEAIGQLHAMAHSGAIPAAVYKDACGHCSLFEICLPRATCAGSRAGRIARQLYET